MLLKNISEKKIAFSILVGSVVFGVSALLEIMLKQFATAAIAGLLAIVIVLVGFIIMNDERWTVEEKLQEQTRTQYQFNEALFAIFSSIKPRLPLPPLDGWAMSPHTVVTLMSELLRHRPEQILELGSGSSTIIASYMLERMGKGNIISLDHDAKYGQITTENLDVHGLSNFARIAHAPLVEIQYENANWLWYDLASVPQVENIKGKVDLLIVDGPPENPESLSRLPAFFLLKDYLNDGAMVILDDYDRPGEVKIAQIACEKYGFKMVSKAVGDNAIVLQKT